MKLMIKGQKVDVPPPQVGSAFNNLDEFWSDMEIRNPKSAKLSKSFRNRHYNKDGTKKKPARFFK